VHLDHAGGAGLLMQSLPAARLLVHPRGARHMIDPTALYDGALAVYGQAEMDRSYGQLVPVPADRVHSPQDGETVHLAGRPCCSSTRRAMPATTTASGTRAAGWFTGDTFGAELPRVRHIGRALADPGGDAAAIRAQGAALVGAAPAARPRLPGPARPP
jgi:glyoxylase-like metal-dependent hydrolase (beta-lactamase superfamily II)